MHRCCCKSFCLPDQIFLLLPDLVLLLQPLSLQSLTNTATIAAASGPVSMLLLPLLPLTLCVALQTLLLLHLQLPQLLLVFLSLWQSHSLLCI